MTRKKKETGESVKNDEVEEMEEDDETGTVEPMKEDVKNEEGKKEESFTDVKKREAYEQKLITYYAHCKLFRRKVNQETLHLLHDILYGTPGEFWRVKDNIARLSNSGFFMPEKEEKLKLELQEKLEKHNKEMLLEFCQIFDMTVSRANAKKEDIVVKLIDFMLAPHPPTSEAAEKLQSFIQSYKGKKRNRPSNKSTSTPEATLSNSLSKKQKTKSTFEEDKKKAAETDNSEEESDEEEKDEEEHEHVNGDPEKSEDEKSDDIASEEEEEHVSEEKESSKKRNRGGSTKSKSSKKESGLKPKEKKVVISEKNSSSSPQKKTHAKSTTNTSKVVDSDSGAKTFSRKKSAPKEKSGKKTVKEKAKPKSEMQKIRDDDLNQKTAICEILKQVDFKTATFTDVFKQLCKWFNTDLTRRKGIIKVMIEEVLTKLADEAIIDEEEEEPEKTAEQASGNGVKA